MGLSCLGDAVAFQLNAWKRHPYSDCYVALTLPDTVSSSDLKYKVTQENGAARSVSYQYEGIEVGSSRGSFYPINAPARSMFSRTAAVGEDTETQEGNQTQSIQIEGLDDVFAQTSAMFRVGYAKVRAYAQSHMMLVIAGCAVLLVLILVFIVILIFRCTSDWPASQTPEAGRKRTQTTGRGDRADDNCGDRSGASRPYGRGANPQGAGKACTG